MKEAGTGLLAGLDEQGAKDLRSDVPVGQVGHDRAELARLRPPPADAGVALRDIEEFRQPDRRRRGVGGDRGAVRAPSDDTIDAEGDSLNPALS